MPTSSRREDSLRTPRAYMRAEGCLSGISKQHPVHKRSRVANDIGGHAKDIAPSHWLTEESTDSEAHHPCCLVDQSRSALEVTTFFAKTQVQGENSSGAFEEVLSNGQPLGSDGGSEYLDKEPPVGWPGATLGILLATTQGTEAGQTLWFA